MDGGKRDIGDIGVDPLDFFMIVAATIFWLQFFPQRTVVMNSCPAKP